MRTFPKSLATFRKIVDERRERLRRIAFEDLKQLAVAGYSRTRYPSKPRQIAEFRTITGYPELT